MAGQHDDPDFLSGDGAKLQALIALAAWIRADEADRADCPAHPPPGDLSNLTDRDIWRHFEVAEGFCQCLSGSLSSTPPVSWQPLGLAEPRTRLDLGKDLTWKSQATSRVVC